MTRKVKFTGLAQNSQVPASGLTENPYQSLRVDPDAGPTLWIAGSGGAAAEAMLPRVAQIRVPAI